MPERPWTRDQLDQQCARPSYSREFQAAWFLLSLLDDQVTEAFLGGPPGLDSTTLVSMS